jgi:hypothetical protein
LIGATLLVATACGSGGTDKAESGTSTTAPATGRTLVFSGQGNRLAVYLGRPPFTKQIATPRNGQHPDGFDISGQICFDPKNPNRFVAADDPHGGNTAQPGWGIFDITDPTVGHLRIKAAGRLVPTYQATNPAPQSFGCGFLDDGRIVTTDVGNQSTGAGDGQLIVWFPPFGSRNPKYCKVDVNLYTGQSALVDGDSVYVTQARPPHAGVYSYAVNNLPTSNTSGGGCNGKDATGAPLATHVRSTLVIGPSTTSGVSTPAGIAKGPNGHLYVASSYTGVIAEFTGDDTFVRDVLKPPPGETLGAAPYSTGTPLGIAVAPDGSLYYADIGLVASSAGTGPGPGDGTVRRITFDASGNPRPPETMDRGLTNPEGLGLWQAPA